MKAGFPGGSDGKETACTLARHAPHVRGEPGAKPFVDDLLLGRGFVRSRAAPSLRSIESQPLTQGFVAPAAGRWAGALRWSVPPSLFSLRGLCLSRAVDGPPSSTERGGGRGAGRGEREKTGAPLTAPPGLGVLRPPPLARGLGRRWGEVAERRAADVSPGASVPFPREKKK